MQISLTKLNDVTKPYLECPYCNGDLKSGVTFFDGETLFLDEEINKKEERYWGSQHVCLCPRCTAELYVLEITVLSHPVKGREFTQDFHHEAQFVENILVDAGSWEWMFERNINVQFEKLAGHDYAGESMPVMDIHSIGLFAEGGSMKVTTINAEKMYQLFLPYVKHIEKLRQAL